MTLDEYKDWLYDTSRDNHRILLIEADHSTGTVHLASRDWVANDGTQYDGWITNYPQWTQTLGDSLDVGDFQAVNPDLGVNWGSYSWRGFECRWLYGDVEWERSKFWPVTSALIGECRRIDGTRHNFDLISPMYLLNKQIRIRQDSNMSFHSAFQWLGEQLGEPIEVDVPNFPENALIDFSISESTTYFQAIKALAEAYGAFIRVSIGKAISIIRPTFFNQPKQHIPMLSEGDIVNGSVRHTDSVPSYAYVEVQYRPTEIDIGSTRISSGANTGALEETFVIYSVFRAEENARYLRDEYRDYVKKPRAIWEMKLSNSFPIVGLDVGEDVLIEHPELNSRAFVKSIKRSPLDNTAFLEVEPYEPKY